MLELEDIAHKNLEDQHQMHVSLSLDTKFFKIHTLLHVS